jgi:hypothetical protein
MVAKGYSVDSFSNTMYDIMEATSNTPGSLDDAFGLGGTLIERDHSLDTSLDAVHDVINSTSHIPESTEEAFWVARALIDKGYLLNSSLDTLHNVIGATPDIPQDMGVVFWAFATLISHGNTMESSLNALHNLAGATSGNTYAKSMAIWTLGALVAHDNPLENSLNAIHNVIFWDVIANTPSLSLPNALWFVGYTAVANNNPDASFSALQDIIDALTTAQIPQAINDAIGLVGTVVGQGHNLVNSLDALHDIINSTSENAHDAVWFVRGLIDRGQSFNDSLRAFHDVIGTVSNTPTLTLPNAFWFVGTLVAHGNSLNSSLNAMSDIIGATSNSPGAINDALGLAGVLAGQGYSLETINNTFNTLEGSADALGETIQLVRGFIDEGQSLEDALNNALSSAGPGVLLAENFESPTINPARWKVEEDTASVIQNLGPIQPPQGTSMTQIRTIHDPSTGEPKAGKLIHDFGIPSRDTNLDISFLYNFIVPDYYWGYPRFSVKLKNLIPLAFHQTVETELLRDYGSTSSLVSNLPEDIFRRSMGLGWQTDWQAFQRVVDIQGGLPTSLEFLVDWEWWWNNDDAVALLDEIRVKGSPGVFGGVENLRLPDQIPPLFQDDFEGGQSWDGWRGGFSQTGSLGPDITPPQGSQMASLKSLWDGTDYMETKLGDPLANTTINVGFKYNFAIAELDQLLNKPIRHTLKVNVEQLFDHLAFPQVISKNLLRVSSENPSEFANSVNIDWQPWRPGWRTDPGKATGWKELSESVPVLGGSKVSLSFDVEKEFIHGSFMDEDDLYDLFDTLGSLRSVALIDEVRVEQDRNVIAFERQPTDLASLPPLFSENFEQGRFGANWGRLNEPWYGINWWKEGNVQVVDSLGPVRPQPNSPNSFMAFVGTRTSKDFGEYAHHDPGRLTKWLGSPKADTTLDIGFKYNFVSGGSDRLAGQPAQHYFTAKLISDYFFNFAFRYDTSLETLLAFESNQTSNLTTVSDLPADKLGSTTGGQTGWKAVNGPQVKVPSGSYNRIVFEVNKTFDSWSLPEELKLLESAVLLDDLVVDQPRRLVEASGPDPDFLASITPPLLKEDFEKGSPSWYWLDRWNIKTLDSLGPITPPQNPLQDPLNNFMGFVGTRTHTDSQGLYRWHYDAITGVDLGEPQADTTLDVQFWYNFLLGGTSQQRQDLRQYARHGFTAFLYGHVRGLPFNPAIKVPLATEYSDTTDLNSPARDLPADKMGSTDGGQTGWAQVQETVNIPSGTYTEIRFEVQKKFLSNTPNELKLLEAAVLLDDVWIDQPHELVQYQEPDPVWVGQNYPLLKDDFEKARLDQERWIAQNAEVVRELGSITPHGGNRMAMITAVLGGDAGRGFLRSNFGTASMAASLDVNAWYNFISFPQFRGSGIEHTFRAYIEGTRGLNTFTQELRRESLSTSTFQADVNGLLNTIGNGVVDAGGQTGWKEIRENVQVPQWHNTSLVFEVTRSGAAGSPAGIVQPAVLIDDVVVRQQPGAPQD